MAPPCHFYSLPPASVAPRPVSYENIPPTPSPGEFMYGQGPYHQESSVSGSYAPHAPTPPTKSSITHSAGRPLNETSSHNASSPLKRKTAPAASPTPRKRQSPRSLQQKVTDGLKGIRASGFNSLGEFLQALFDPHASYSEQDQGPLQTVSAFIGGLNGDGQRPADIVEAWYSHPRNCKDTRTPACDAISSMIPKFSVPIGCKLTTEPSMTSIRGVSARWSLKVWASRVAISTINEESEILANEPSFRAPEQWSWDMLDTISIKGFQEKVMKLAPLTWSLFTTIAVSPYRRDQIAEARNAIHRHGEDSPVYVEQVDKINSLANNPWSVRLISSFAASSISNLSFSLTGLRVSRSGRAFAAQPPDLAHPQPCQPLIICQQHQPCHIPCFRTIRAMYSLLYSVGPPKTTGVQCRNSASRYWLDYITT